MLGPSRRRAAGMVSSLLLRELSLPSSNTSAFGSMRDCYLGCTDHEPPLDAAQCGCGESLP